MRRLLLLFVALVVVYGGQSILQGGEPSPAVALRDGGLVLLVAAAFFAVVAAPPVERAWRHGAVTWPWWARVLFIGGLVLGSVGGWLLLGDRLTGAPAGLPAGLWLGGIVVATVGSLWGRSARTQETAAAWSVEAARQFVARVRQRQALRVVDPVPLPGRTRLLLLTLAALLGLLVRIWGGGLAAGCDGAGCEAALGALRLLRTGDFTALLLDPAPTFTLLTALAFGLFGPNLETLRLFGLILGTATIPVFYLAAARTVRAGTALVGVLLLLLSPWHIALSRRPTAGTVLVLWLLAFVWARLWAEQTGDRRWWTLAALLGGLAAWTLTPLAALLLLLWFLIAYGREWRPWLAFWLLALVTALPRLLLLLDSARRPAFSSDRIGDNLAQWLRQMLTQPSLWAPLTALLALLGLAYLLRSIRWSPARLLLTGVILLAAPLLVGIPGPQQPSPASLPALLLLVAVIALDQYVGETARIWAPVLRPATVLAVATLLLLAVLGVGAGRGLSVLADSQSPGSGSTSTAQVIGRYLQARFQASVDNGGADGTLILVPAYVLADPATRLAAGGVLAHAPHIVALDPVLHLPFVGSPFLEQRGSSLLYVVPVEDVVLDERLRQVYPEGQTEPLLDAEERTVALLYRVDRGPMESIQGLPVRYFEGDEAGTPDEAVLVGQEGPLDFGWDLEPPILPPFSVTGQGLLYAPESGVYHFQAGTSGDSVLTLTLGIENGEPHTVLDTAQGRREGAVRLRQGFHPVRLDYRSGDSGGDLSIRWQRPGGRPEPIPRQALYNLPFESGLLATYYAGGDASPTSLDDLASLPVLAERQEPFLFPGPLATEAAGVVWQAKLAAPVEGRFDFAGETEGAIQLRLDGVTVLESGEGAASGAGSILLGRGWHDLEVRFRGGSAPSLRLTWQVPGAAPGPIPARYLVPLAPDVDTAALPVPLAPAPASQPVRPETPAPVVEAPTVFREPASDALPTDLPPLPLELAWEVGGCGRAEDEFLQPRGVAITPLDNRVTVADAGNRRLVVRSLLDGSLVDVYTSDRYEEPFDVDADILGQVYVLDAAAQEITRLEGGVPAPVPVETAFYRPRGLGVDITGMLYVADTGGARVVMSDAASGQVVAQFGGPDTPLGQGQPVDVVALPNGAIWAVSAEDGRLWRLDTGEGQAAAAPSNTFDAPHFAGLVNSTFFLTDPERRLILYYGVDGRPGGQFTDARFERPVGISAVVDAGQLRLAVSDSAACTLSLWTGPVGALP